MGREITITDTTLRDGHQSLWAARMPFQWMIPVAERQERSGVAVVDVIGHTHYITCVRYLKEDPWARVRTMRSILSRPLLSASTGGQLAGSFRIAPTDIRELFVECSVKNGIDLIRGAHGLLDVEIMTENLRAAKARGAGTILPLVYSISPVHTDELFATRALEIMQQVEVDYVMIKDSGGLLTPERTGSLVDAIHAVAGNAKVTLHSHCMTGLAPRVYMVAAEHGVDDLQCGIWPLALGSAQPALQSTVRNLREEGYAVGVDDAEIDAASNYLVELAKREKLPLGEAQEYDHFHYRHQIPGGMITNLETQLRDAGLLDRLPGVLEEVAIVRAELGWPTMVTPFSQFVANQALFNVLSGKRYSTVPDEVKLYALGYYGRPLVDIEQNVLDKILARGAQETRVEVERGLEVMRRPVVPQLRKLYPHASDEEILLRYMCAPTEVDAMAAAMERRSQGWEAVGLSSRAGVRLTSLLGKMAGLDGAAEVTVTKGHVTATLRH